MTLNAVRFKNNPIPIGRVRGGASEAHHTARERFSCTHAPAGCQVESDRSGV
jgi:hypothetical protein